ncbi:alpha/beta hydrolase fold containing protein, partial [Tanacetum coccineum]
MVSCSVSSKMNGELPLHPIKLTREVCSGESLAIGKYSEWNEDNPIHFVGHSAGAQVIRMLQQMLADK